MLSVLVLSGAKVAETTSDCRDSMIKVAAFFCYHLLFVYLHDEHTAM